MKTIKIQAIFLFLFVLPLLGGCKPQNPREDAPKEQVKSVETAQANPSTEPELIPPPAEDDYFAWGHRYYFGLAGVEQDYKKAFEFFNKSHQREDDCANMALGNMYYMGQGVQKDVQKALKLWNEGDACNTRDGNNIYSFNAFNHIKEYISENKDKEYAFIMGNSCFGRFSRESQCGHSSSPDDDYRDACDQGEIWYKLAADLGHPEAKVRLADNYLIYANIHHNCYGAFNGDGNGFGDAVEEHEHRLAGESLLLSAAGQGYTDAMEELGDMYFYGRLPLDHKKAEEWYLKAARKGNKYSAFMLARLYSGGKDSAIPANYQKAYYWANEAVKKGVSEANYYLGLLYYNGNGVTKDHKKALSLFKQVKQEGTYEWLLAGLMLQNMYVDEEGSQEDFRDLYNEKERCYYYYCTKGWIFGKDNYAKAEEKALWQAAFERNDILAQIHLMQKYKNSTDESAKESALVLRSLIALHPAPQNEYAKQEWQSAKKAIAAEQPSVPSITNYDQVNTETLLKAALVKNDTEAQRKIATSFINKSKEFSDYSAQDPFVKQAAEWYFLASRLGDNIAQAQLASMYGKGSLGTYQSYYDPNTIPEEIYWLEKSAEQGNPIAEYELANKYYNDVFFTDELGAIYSQSFRELYLVRNLQKAFELYKKSAEAGYTPAMGKLSYMYKHGEYVYPDYQEAEYWEKMAKETKLTKTPDTSVNFYIKEK